MKGEDTTSFTLSPITVTFTRSSEGDAETFRCCSSEPKDAPGPGGTPSDRAVMSFLQGMEMAIMQLKHTLLAKQQQQEPAPSDAPPAAGPPPAPAPAP